MIRALALLLLLAGPVWAVQPSEMLDDPVLEARARALSSGLRCPVCQNETIDESNAPLSGELRVVLRERLVAGDTDAEVIEYMVARYGEFVLLKPDARGVNLVLWLAAPVLLLVALGVGYATTRRKAATPDAPLSDAEQAALDRILKS
jgi:cytochrome c-type biogenesis protein CcmH